MMACALLAFAARLKYNKRFTKDISHYVPLLAFYIPSIQYILFKFSWFFGNPYGPFITEALTYYPLAAMTIYPSACFLEKVKFEAYGAIFAEHVPAIGTYCLFTAAEKFAKIVIGMKIGSNFMFSRVGLQLVIAALYGLVVPSAFLWPALPSIIFNLGYNMHTPLAHTTTILNNTLSTYNYTLLERKESLTGYISVIENTEQHFRVMRCDHSLLGGQWMLSKPAAGTPSAPEPIYAIFAMLEAVRLVELENGEQRRPDSESSALTM